VASVHRERGSPFPPPSALAPTTRPRVQAQQMKQALAG